MSSYWGGIQTKELDDIKRNAAAEWEMNRELANQQVNFSHPMYNPLNQPEVMATRTAENVVGMPDYNEPTLGGVQPPPVQQAMQQMPMSNVSMSNFTKAQGRAEKEDTGRREKFQQMMDDYMSKREQIAIDTQGRLEKLDSQQAAKGPNLSALMAFADTMAQGSTMAGGPSALKTYQQSGQMPMSPEQLTMMKQKLQDRASGQYQGMTKDAMNVLRQEDLKDQWGASNTLRARLAKLKSGEKRGVEKKYNTDQMAFATFGRVMKQAENNFNNLMTVYRDDITSGKTAAYLFSPSPTKPEYVKKLEQVIKQFTAAKLRKESGAAIAESEYKNVAKELFPQWNDTPDVLAQKASARKLQIDNYKQASGGAYEDIESKSSIKVGGGSASKPQYTLEQIAAERSRRGR